MTEPVIPRRLSIIRKGGASDERSQSVPLRVKLTPEKPDVDISERFGWRRAQPVTASRGGYA